MRKSPEKQNPNTIRNKKCRPWGQPGIKALQIQAALHPCNLTRENVFIPLTPFPIYSIAILSENHKITNYS